MAADFPPGTTLERLRKQAKQWLMALRGGEADARARFDRAHPKPPADPGLRDVQHALAREMGFASWARLNASLFEHSRPGASEASALTSLLDAADRGDVDRLRQLLDAHPELIDGRGELAGSTDKGTAPHVGVGHAPVVRLLLEQIIWREAERALLAGDDVTLERLLKRHEALFRSGRPPDSTPGGLAPDYSRMDAREIIIRNHRFDSWEAYAVFADEAKSSVSLTARFEEAADAIVAGDIARLDWLLKGRPDLIRARSARMHHAMLIHYVGPNGIEYFRQITPVNAPDVARLLIGAGADVNATADIYGGGANVLGLAATSITPVLAGVVEPLLQALIDGGATIAPDGGALVNGCLHNGRDEAAAFLASRGADVDLEAAAGIGRLDLVRACFDEDGGLKPPSTPEQMKDGFAWACEFGRAEIARFLIERGMDVRARLKHHGQTGLHWAAGGGHVETVKVLLEHAAPVDATDGEWNATPMEWALFGWRHRRTPGVASERYYAVVRLLIGAGATVKPEWLDEEAVAKDPVMQSAFRGM